MRDGLGGDGPGFREATNTYNDTIRTITEYGAALAGYLRGLQRARDIAGGDTCP